MPAVLRSKRHRSPVTALIYETAKQCIFGMGRFMQRLFRMPADEVWHMKIGWKRVEQYRVSTSHTSCNLLGGD